MKKVIIDPYKKAKAEEYLKQLILSRTKNDNNNSSK